MDELFKKKCLVRETKGLLTGVNEDVRRIEVNLSFDNIFGSITSLNQIQDNIDYIIEKIKKLETECKQAEEANTYNEFI